VQFYDFDAFRIDVQRRLLLRDGSPVSIKPKALETLRRAQQRRRQKIALFQGEREMEYDLTFNTPIVKAAK
jgi:hypothetical protein